MDWMVLYQICVFGADLKSNMAPGSQELNISQNHFHLPDRTSPVNNSESMQQQTFWSPSQWLLSIIEAMRRWKMKRSSITDFFSPKLKQNKGLYLRIHDYFAVICPPLAPLFIQNGCGYPVFQALMHFNKFLWRRYRPLFCLSFGLSAYPIVSVVQGLVISTFGLAEIICCMPDGLVKKY
jgi:hypothetical protein